MGLTNAGLADIGYGKGVTAHYSFSYNTSLLPAGLAYTSGLMQEADGDFELWSGPVGDLNSVYQQLTGDSDGWTPFINLVNLYCPPGVIYHPLSDDLFPLSDLASFSAPHEITCGYSNTAVLTIDNPAKAEVNVTLESNKSVLANAFGTGQAALTINPAS